MVWQWAIHAQWFRSLSRGRARPWPWRSCRWRAGARATVWRGRIPADPDPAQLALRHHLAGAAGPGLYFDQLPVCHHPTRPDEAGPMCEPNRGHVRHLRQRVTGIKRSGEAWALRSAATDSGLILRMWLAPLTVTPRFSVPVPASSTAASDASNWWTNYVVAALDTDPIDSSLEAVEETKICRERDARKSSSGRLTAERRRGRRKPGHVLVTKHQPAPFFRASTWRSRQGRATPRRRAGCRRGRRNPT
jgi:hypothetical protein